MPADEYNPRSNGGFKHNERSGCLDCEQCQGATRAQLKSQHKKISKYQNKQEQKALIKAGKKGEKVMVKTEQGLDNKSKPAAECIFCIAKRIFLGSNSETISSTKIMQRFESLDNS